MRIVLYNPDENQAQLSGPSLPAGEYRDTAEPQKSAHAIVRTTVGRIVFSLICVPSALLIGTAVIRSNRELFQDLRLLILFLSIVACSAYGGILSGLLGTALAYAGVNLLRLHHGLVLGLSPADSALLAAEGLAVNLIGWALDAARARARRRDATVLQLQRQILEIGDEERQRIGHDLHDNLGQQLTGISLLGESIAQQLAVGKHPSSSEMEHIISLASNAVRQTRELARSLSPLTLEHDGFLAAMDELSATASSLFKVDCRWEYDGPDPGINPRRALNLYRIVQEAVSNSVKHGKARRVIISAQIVGTQFAVEIADDGSGLSRKTAENPGLGLRTMAYRARMLGAQLLAERANGAGGTVIRCICPLVD